LDLSDFVNLELLNCPNNKLTSLNLSNCPKLTHLVCKNNKIDSFDLTKCTELEAFDCSDNLLTSLSLFNNIHTIIKLVLKILKNSIILQYVRCK
jgi:Leucine-rich repeat (LRR) protein